jgi:serine/threonine-protein kinase
LERKVAVKVVSTPADMKALKKELSFLTEIRSAHIAEVYDVLEAQSGKHIGLVEQYVSGGHLRDLVGNCNLDAFMRTMYQLSCGIADIHAQKKVHRDIKPGNIRFDEENVLKILDFGISQHVDIEAKTSNGKGTHPYIAPELYKLPGKYNSAVDIYACGVIAHELAFGKIESCLKSIPPQTATGPKKLSTSPLGIPSDVGDLLDRALSPMPHDRPPINEIKTVIERRLAFGGHRAAITYGKQSTLLNDTHKSVSLKSQDCSLTITYDGLRFVVSTLSGKVDVNNVKITAGQELPASCVITMNTQNGHRDFITIDMSNPSILL